MAYASKSLSDVEKRYACIERELLAIVFGMTRFHTYLYGRQFKVLTDYKPLVMIVQKNLSSAPPRLQRLLLKLQGYNYTLEYLKGSEMTIADTLSRLPNEKESQTIDLDIRVDHVKFSTDRVESIRAGTKADPMLQELTNIVLTGWPNSIQDLPHNVRSFWSCRDEISIDNGILMKGTALIIPHSLQHEILSQLHYGHLGIVKTRLRAKNTVYWTNINKDRESVIKGCDVCQEHKPRQTYKTLICHEIPSRPWQILGTDLIDWNGSKWPIIVDYYTKYPFVRKLGNPCSSNRVVSATKQLFSEMGIPEKIISDNGPHFSSSCYTQFASEWKFYHTTSSPNYPRSNGFVERQIQTVGILQKCYQSKGDLDMGLLCLRTTPVDHQIKSPAELLFGRKLKSNLPGKIPNTLDDKNIIQGNYCKRQNSQKRYHDLHAKDLTLLKPGDYIQYQDMSSRKWIPGVVKDKCEQPRSYLIVTPNGNTLRRNRQQLRGRSEQFIPRRIQVENTPESTSVAKTPDTVKTNDNYVTK